MRGAVEGLMQLGQMQREELRFLPLRFIENIILNLFPGDEGLHELRLRSPGSPLPAPSPGLGLCGHLPLLMKIHGFISISGVISETAKHKTGLFPLRPGEPDRMTRLSALAERGSCGA
ncbi:hypothetical protein NQZ68_031536 [Dissostichus eleginoides]|nr:hypothetical protein NQZ68_031536 [Dissostichus eleginoides]